MMTGSQVTIWGYVAKTPNFTTDKAGRKYAVFNVRTYENWKDSTTGEPCSDTQYHRVNVRAQGLISMVEGQIKEGRKVLCIGKLHTKTYYKDNRKAYVTEVVIDAFSGKLCLLDAQDAPLAQQALL